MRRNILTALTLLAAAPFAAAVAQNMPMQNMPMQNMPMQNMHQHMDMPMHPGAMSAADSRELLNFPPPMQAHFLGNMRDHVETLNAIIALVAEGKFGEASQVAATRLGLNSPAAAGCKPTEAGAAPPPKDSMDAMMQLYMPDQMRAIGLSMHTAASDFAVVAAKAETTHDTAAVLKSLAQITPNCVACHTAYRIR